MLCGWCMTGSHECIVKVEKIYFETRKKKDILVRTGEFWYCTCKKCAEDNKNRAQN